MIINKLDSIEFRLKELHDFTWLKKYGTAFWVSLSDSFQDNLLAPPVYTRPAEYKGWKVPEILLSGHQRKIEEWQHEQSIERTRRLRPDLLDD